MVNRNDGQLISGSATRKVILQEAQMVCCMRIS